MKEMDLAHISTWLHCLIASSDLDHALGPRDMVHLMDWLDLPTSHGGARFNSLFRSSNEEFLGSFAAFAASLTTFCWKTELPVYTCIADALEGLGDTVELLEEAVPP